MANILIAETDPRTRDFLPRILSDYLPDVAVDVCASAEDLRDNRKLSTYDAIAISPLLLQGYRLLKHKAARHLFAPLLVTASLQDRALASLYLEKEAFGLIVKPIDEKQAAQAVQLALWQNGLLKLLASQERALLQFEEHMNRYPDDLRAEAWYTKRVEILDKTFHAVQMSMRLLLNSEEERSCFDMAAAVEQFAKQRALDRLLMMSEAGAIH